MEKMTSARICQLLFLLVFLVLFVHTEYRGSDTISAAVNSFFRADLLVLVSYLAATRSFTWLLFPRRCLPWSSRHFSDASSAAGSVRWGRCWIWSPGASRRPLPSGYSRGT
jgi:hypothetical protein